MHVLILVAHNLRSAHNVGSILRTADGLGIQHVYLTGYTPYPATAGDKRLPHESRRIDAQIHKTALGAEHAVAWTHTSDILTLLSALKAEGYALAALEQNPNSLNLPSYQPHHKTALVVGREVEGIEPEVLDKCDVCLEIPMQGAKESYNVAIAAAIGMYHLRYCSDDST